MGTILKNARLRMFLRARLKDLCIIALVLLAIEFWSSRHMRSVPTIANNPSITAVPLYSKNKSLPIWQNGTYTFIYAFAPWCMVCSASASNINRLAASQQSDIHTVGLALSWSSRDAVLEFLKQAKLEAPILLGEPELASSLHIDSFPSYLIVGPDGDIIWAWSGYTTELGILLRLQLSKLLASFQVWDLDYTFEKQRQAQTFHFVTTQL